MVNRKYIPKICRGCRRCKSMWDAFTGRKLSNYCEIHTDFLGKKCPNNFEPKDE